MKINTGHKVVDINDSSKTQYYHTITCDSCGVYLRSEMINRNEHGLIRGSGDLCAMCAEIPNGYHKGRRL